MASLRRSAGADKAEALVLWWRSLTLALFQHKKSLWREGLCSGSGDGGAGSKHTLSSTWPHVAASPWLWMGWEAAKVVVGKYSFPTEAESQIWAGKVHLEVWDTQCPDAHPVFIPPLTPHPWGHQILHSLGFSKQFSWELSCSQRTSKHPKALLLEQMFAPEPRTFSFPPQQDTASTSCVPLSTRRALLTKHCPPQPVPSSSSIQTGHAECWGHNWCWNHTQRLSMRWSLAKFLLNSMEKLCLPCLRTSLTTVQKQISF